MKYTPDSWVIVKIITPDEILYKVLGGWRGGYLDGDYWRLNSGITEAERTRHNSIYFSGYSGSLYDCYINRYGFILLTHDVYSRLELQIKEKGLKIELLDKAEAVSLNWIKNNNERTEDSERIRKE
jgi:hypothetical protein